MRLKIVLGLLLCSLVLVFVSGLAATVPGIAVVSPGVGGTYDWYDCSPGTYEGVYGGQKLNCYASMCDIDNYKYFTCAYFGSHISPSPQGCGPTEVTGDTVFCANCKSVYPISINNRCSPTDSNKKCCSDNTCKYLDGTACTSQDQCCSNYCAPLYAGISGSTLCCPNSNYAVCGGCKLVDSQDCIEDTSCCGKCVSGDSSPATEVKCCPNNDYVWCTWKSGVMGACRKSLTKSCSLDDDCCGNFCVSGICSCGYYQVDVQRCKTSVTGGHSCNPTDGGLKEDSDVCIAGKKCDGGLVVENKCILCNADGTVQYVEWEGNVVIGESGTCEFSCGASPECDEQSPDSAFCTSDCQSRLLDVYLYPVEINPG